MQKISISHWLALLCFMSSFISSYSYSHPEEGQATYLGNEGVLVTDGETKVLFDAFYDNAYQRFVLVPDSIMNPLMAGQPPYDNIDAVFVSHAHGDHFAGKITVDYLKKFTHVQFYGPTPAVKMIRELLNDPQDPLLKRLNIIDLKPGDKAINIQQDNIDIDAVALSHIGGERMASVMNIVFRVTLNKNTTVIHMGDAGIDEKEIANQQAHWQQKNTDTLFPIYFVLEDDNNKKILVNYIKPSQIIGIHVPKEAVGKGDLWRARVGSDLFTDPGESRSMQTGKTHRHDQ